MTPEAVPVAVHGFTWTAGLMAILNLLVGGALVAWIKQRPKMRELEQTAEEKFVATLTERVTTVERQREEDRQRYDASVASIEQKMDAERNRHEVEARLLRHRANNSDQCVDTLIILLEDAEGLPDRVRRAITAVKEMRARQKQQEALEKGSMLGAQLAKTDPPTGG